MTGFIVSVFPFRNRVSSKEAFEGLELGEGKPSRPVLRGPGGRKAARLLGRNGLGKRCRRYIQNPRICCKVPALMRARNTSLKLVTEYSRFLPCGQCDPRPYTLGPG